MAKNDRTTETQGTTAPAGDAFVTVTRKIEAGDKDKVFAETPLNGAEIRFARANGSDIEAVRRAVESGAFSGYDALLSAAYGVRESRVLADIKRKAVPSKRTGKVEISEVSAAQTYADGYKMEGRGLPSSEISDSKRKQWDKLAAQLTPAIAAGAFGATQLRHLVTAGQLDPAWVEAEISAGRAK